MQEQDDVDRAVKENDDKSSHVGDMIKGDK